MAEIQTFMLMVAPLRGHFADLGETQESIHEVVNGSENGNQDPSPTCGNESSKITLPRILTSHFKSSWEIHLSFPATIATTTLELQTKPLASPLMLSAMRGKFPWELVQPTQALIIVCSLHSHTINCSVLGEIIII